MRFSGYESASHTALGKAISTGVLGFYAIRTPQMLGLLTAVTCAAGLVFVVVRVKQRPQGMFWLCWLVSYSLCIQLARLREETRYFLFALPALIGCAAGLFPRRPWLTGLLLAIAIATNLYELRRLPRGLVGYAAVAGRLAALDLPGNVLLACSFPQDLAFRFREQNHGIRRRFIRADRSLAVRVAHYFHAPATLVAVGGEGVLDVLRRGRVRYLLTTSCDLPADCTEEMALAHRTAESSPVDFALIRRDPLLIDFEGSPRRPAIRGGHGPSMGVDATALR